jgi:hypothetical protein
VPKVSSKKNGQKNSPNGHDLKPALVFLNLKPEQIVAPDTIAEEVAGWRTAYDTYKAASDEMGISPGHISRIARGLSNAGPKVLNKLGMGRQWQYYRKEQHKKTGGG